jgi:hypothetical protein
MRRMQLLWLVLTSCWSGLHVEAQPLCAGRRGSSLSAQLRRQAHEWMPAAHSGLFAWKPPERDKGAFPAAFLSRGLTTPGSSERVCRCRHVHPECGLSLTACEPCKFHSPAACHAALLSPCLHFQSSKAGAIDPVNTLSTRIASENFYGPACICKPSATTYLFWLSVCCPQLLLTVRV